MPQKTSVLEKLAAVWGRSGSNSKKKKKCISKASGPHRILAWVERADASAAAGVALP